MPRRNNRRTSFFAPALALTAAAVWPAPVPAQVSGAAPEPDWPCVQVYVPDVSPGQLWSGPAIEEVTPRWRDDAEVRRLVALAVGGEVPLPAFDAEVAALAEAAGEERNQALTALFAGIYEAHAERRRAALQAIKRYARHQDALHARIAGTLAALDAAEPGSREAAAVEEALQWQRRILDDRRRALEAVCEQPVLVEQQLGIFARAITPHLE